MGPHRAGTFLASMEMLGPSTFTRAVPPRTSGPGFFVLRLHLAAPGPMEITGGGLPSLSGSQARHDRAPTLMRRAVLSDFVMAVIVTRFGSLSKMLELGRLQGDRLMVMPPWMPWASMPRVPWYTRPRVYIASAHSVTVSS